MSNFQGTEMHWQSFKWIFSQSTERQYFSPIKFSSRFFSTNIPILLFSVPRMDKGHGSSTCPINWFYKTFPPSTANSFVHSRSPNPLSHAFQSLPLLPSPPQTPCYHHSMVFLVILICQNLTLCESVSWTIQEKAVTQLGRWLLK